MHFADCKIYFSDGLTAVGHVKATLLNHSKNVRNVLKKDFGDVGDGVDVIFGVVGQVGAGHETQVGEYGVQALADAVVEFADRGVAVNEEDRVAGGELGHRGEAAGRVVHFHKDMLFKRIMKRHLSAAKQRVAAMCGFADRRRVKPADPKVSHTQPP